MLIIMPNPLLKLWQNFNASVFRHAMTDSALALVKRQDDPHAVKIAFDNLVFHANSVPPGELRDHALTELAGAFHGLSRPLARQMLTQMPALEPLVATASPATQKTFAEAGKFLLAKGEAKQPEFAQASAFIAKLAGQAP